MNKDLAASVRARLLNLAKAEQSDFNSVLVRYTQERLLYRLSQSTHANCFLLRGAMLFTLWYDMPHRPTRDIDLFALDHVIWRLSRKQAKTLLLWWLKTASVLTPIA